MTTFIVSMPPNPSDGRRKTTKVNADSVVREVVREDTWLVFTREAARDEDEVVAEFVNAESWVMEDVVRSPAAPE